MMTPKYYRRPQRDGFHYYEVRPGQLLTLNFLNSVPLIETTSTGTADVREVGEPISKEEFGAAFERAMIHPEVRIL